RPAGAHCKKSGAIQRRQVGRFSGAYAKANDLEPSAYINYVLAQIGEADTLEKLEALLPWNVPLEPIAKKVAQYNEGK
ncbi:transposase domain-containing protein, partial [Aeromonas caviae]